jgi:hypothetical protein
VNAACQSGNIVIPTATHNAGMGKIGSMQPFEVGPVERQDDSTGHSGEFQDPLVGLTSLPGFLHCQNIVTKVPQYFDNFGVEILVRIELGHRGSRLGVASNKPLNLIGIVAAVFPGSVQVGRLQAGNAAEDVGIG